MTLPSDARERFDAFLENLDMLMERRLVRDRMGTILNPDKDDLRAFLVDFRRFYLVKSRINILKVLAEVGRYAPDTETIEIVKKLKKAWLQALSAGPFTLHSHGKNWSPKEIIDLYLNGYYFHPEKDKTEILKKISPPDFPFAEAQFLAAMVPLTQVIIIVGKLIRESGTWTATRREPPSSSAWRCRGWFFPTSFPCRSPLL